ncbi:trifunctional serine/threonine-protein kinase/ATP-binding protein/sensor histidine kinase [Nostoc sp. 'Peltigera membranacea cyanobiont' N6]|uniref:trifunctional serine/threonine-protein kinase/ATP-binding protein/sensor histidine kinase n=1 Tax=Nostoc sp. 'Peltigera membranacea cyanobiont' N6 TaxID=1261031 RepID=UPI000CF34228|nr:ATP-binding sensor histidine kinase [Nostoc sp. 'Peltigera membranacea cyanobiont' N6]AVH67649.1 multi-sensor signal transduction multi-kinase [Nostoc sp. 'Peltigera membranacea cyanobiont' N6]
MVSTLVPIPGYHVSEELYNGSRTLVYRGYREADQKPVVIKLLRNPYPSFTELVQFRNQYTIAKNLNSPLIIQTYSLEPYQNGYALVMEDFGGISLKKYFTHDQTRYIASLEEFLQIAIALCNTLDILYHERIIHKDIKPANILINPETKQVKLIDFSIASLLPRETQTLVNPNVLEGTLAYISPEQTGRMNRGIDYRTDFYSLGVTFYELLAGKLPFASNEPMELVHSHIAKMPMALGNREEIPQVLCDIVMKLMAKNAEDRYQSALGLKFDLENCLTQLQVSGEIKGFEIASRDLCDRFIIPDKLYGRETEVSTLLQAFERVSLGTTEMMLVAGFSGIGKTAVVNEVHKPIVQQRGYFIKGKYDQFQRNIPFSAFVQAFRDLMGQLLTESDVQIQQWKSNILEAVGENGQVIIEVIPELSRIIGIQPAVPELSGTAAQNRFNSIFQKFISIFTTKKHPLVMFLDDLQWADSASLKLVELLMGEESGYLLLIGAYRDNEVSPIHPLMMTLKEMHNVGAVINSITLQVLSENTLNRLVTDTLNCIHDIATPLTQLIYQKTQGNPFFSTQFLKALYEDNLIVFNSDLGCWQCDITLVKQAALTDDVVEFMAQQLQKLPFSTQGILKLAACIGNQFNLMTLASVSQQSENETAAALWKALQEALVLPESEIYKFYIADKEVIYQQEMSHVVNYRFSHDRIQQAAYSLILDEDKQATHLQIGRLLLSNTSDSEQTDKLFDIANQLNMGISLIADDVEKSKVAKINLNAAEKARRSTAYSAAFSYAEKGMSLLDDNSWQRQYNITLGLHDIAAGTAFLTGRFAEITQLMQVVKLNSQTVVDNLAVYEAQIQAYSAQKNYQKSIDTGLEFLQLLGIKLPSQPSKLQVLAELIKTKVLLRGNSLEKLLQLPVMTNPETIVVLRISNLISYPAYFCSQPLMALLAFMGVQKSLQQGNSIWSSSFYTIYSIILSNLQELEASYQMGQFSLKLLNKLPNLYIEGKIKVSIAIFSQIWQQPLSNSLHLIQEGKQAALNCGDFAFVGTGYFTEINVGFFLGKPLTELLPISELYHQALITEIPDEVSLQQIIILRQVMLNLTEASPQPYILVGTECDETQLIPHFQASNDAVFLSIIYCFKVLIAYLFSNISVALDAADASLPYEPELIGINGIISVWFYDALTRLAAYPNSSPQRKKQLLKRVTKIQHNLERRAKLVPTDIKHKCDLIRAERDRIFGNKLQAQEYYDLAILGAKQNGYIQEEALANELAAKFYLECGKEKIAQVYMQEAYYCYARWGAKAKVTDLEKRYPQLLEFLLKQQKLNLNLNPLETIGFAGTFSSTYTNTTGGTNISDVLDFTSALKAAQAISSSLELDTLIASLTRIILENSGAIKAVLLLPQENIWQVRAITFIDNEEIQTSLSPQSLDNCQDIPVKIIHYVKNTQQTVIIDSCKTDIPGLIGEYMLSHQPQSVFCTPIINQGLMVGILYLENKMIQGVFNSDRLSVIHLLSSQAAISLENARLYQQAGIALEDLQQAQLQIVQSEKMSALGNLVAGVAHEMNNPLGFISASLQQAKPTLTDIVEHLKLHQESVPNPGDEIKHHAEKIDLDYSLEDLPKIIDSMVMACDRLTNISTSLRTFSRADKDYKVPFNIHEGIDSTILILKHRLKANEQRPEIEVITDYGNLPQVECFPGQLNQVFMNILANAIDALDESNMGRSFREIKSNPNRITIKISLKNKSVKIAIADNGKGMSESVKQKIFDHLFTTKAVGKGTGLGLAIARQIVEETHGGKLSFNSVMGQGTEFVIEIPV